LVDTPMTDWARENVKQDEMIRPEDIAEAIRFLMRTSRNCVVPEIVFARPSEALEGGLP
jgi:NADP-dependent 3-hydroxy acid dehydrogenase YdfG